MVTELEEWGQEVTLLSCVLVRAVGGGGGGGSDDGSFDGGRGVG